MFTLEALSAAGGWAVFAFAAFWLAIGFHRGWVVPGWVYRASEERAKVSATQADRNSESLAMVARWFDDRRVSIDDRPR